MKNKRFCIFYLLSVVGVALLTTYPMAMGIRVLAEMVRSGAIPVENYPKYVIPYAPISLALLLGVLLIPVMQRLSQKQSFLWGTVFSVGVFSTAEHLMET